jgi:hypothetical protein
MLYFVLGFIIGIAAYWTYQFIVVQYLRVKSEVRRLRNEREYCLKEIANMRDYFEWRRVNK